MKESGTEKEGHVQVELDTAREWKKEGDMLDQGRSQGSRGPGRRVADEK